MIYLEGRDASANSVFLQRTPLDVAHKAAGTARKSPWRAELQTQEILTKN